MGIYEETAAENLKASSRKTISQLILVSRAELPTKKTFPSGELSLPVDGSTGDMIHFLGERQPYGCGRLMLLSQLQILSEQDTNPFECTSSDSEEAYPTLYLLDSDHKEDSYMKLSELCSLYFTLSIAVVLTCKL